MIKTRISQFKVALASTIFLVLTIGGYVVIQVIDFNLNHAFTESQFLIKYSERAISRYKANPQLFKGLEGAALSRLLGNDRVNMVFSYAALQQRFSFVPSQNEFKNHTPKIILLNYRGFFSTQNYLIVLANKLETGETFYSYLSVDYRLNDSKLDLQIFARVQFAILVAIICILLLVILELFHINKANASINNFSEWAEKLSAGKGSPPVPTFSSSKYNYMAYAIDKSLSGITQMFEQERSFAKFTSHELRTPVAALSANMELLELIMKDLSPQERKLLNNMEDAVSDMKYQMEALLWLTRESEEDIDEKLCDTSLLIEKSIQDNAYLIEGKNIALKIHRKNCTLISHPVLLQIILNNLLRNAYQNTQEGVIDIVLDKNYISIENINNHSSMPGKKATGFGIGLMLVEKLVHKLGIDFNVAIKDFGRSVSLRFK